VNDNKPGDDSARKKKETLFGPCIGSCGSLLAIFIGVSQLSEAITTGVFQGARRGYSYYYARIDDPVAYWSTFALTCLLLCVVVFLFFNSLSRLAKWLKD
jgi:hypothetical protein